MPWKLCQCSDTLFGLITRYFRFIFFCFSGIIGMLFFNGDGAVVYIGGRHCFCFKLFFVRYKTYYMSLRVWFVSRDGNSIVSAFERLFFFSHCLSTWFVNDIFSYGGQKKLIAEPGPMHQPTKRSILQRKWFLMFDRAVYYSATFSSWSYFCTDSSS